MSLTMLFWEQVMIPPTLVDWLLCGRAVGGGGGGGVGDVVMLASSLDVGDAIEDIWMFWATSMEFDEEGEDVWVGWQARW